MRLNRLPLELTIGNNLRGPENGCEKQCSDWIAGKYQVYSDNVANGKLSGKSILKTISTTDGQNKVFFYSVLYAKSVFLTHTQSFL